VGSLFIFALTYCAVGLVLFRFAHEIATAVNRFSVKFYELFPALKRLPLGSRLAGTPQNYKSLFYCSRILGGLMMTGGLVFLGLVMLRRR
jgi:hypothetical protein